MTQGQRGCGWHCCHLDGWQYKIQRWLAMSTPPPPPSGDEWRRARWRFFQVGSHREVCNLSDVYSISLQHGTSADEYPCLCHSWVQSSKYRHYIILL
jgi:hypothetical protein